MVKLCIADNHPVVHQGIKSCFKDSTEIEVSNYVTSLEDLYEVLDNKSIQLVVFDIELNGITSIRDIKILIRNNPLTKFLIFTNVSENLYARNALKVGVNGYIEKKSSVKELNDAIIKTLNEETFISENVKKLLPNKKNKIEPILKFHKRLSYREVEVLKNLSNGLKNKEIAVLLNLDEKTISTYKLRLLKKLEVTNLIDLINKAKSLGLI